MVQSSIVIYVVGKYTNVNSICTTVHRVGIKLKNIVMNNMDVFVTRYITK